MSDSTKDVIKVSADDVVETISPEKVEIISPVERTPALRNAALPAVGAALLWIGRELVPHLGNLTLNFLDRRTQSPSALARRSGTPADDRPQSALRGQGRGRGPQRRRQQQGGRRQGRGRGQGSRKR